MSDYAKLEELTQMILDAELAELRARAEEVAKIRATREELVRARTERADRLSDAPPEDDLAFSTGQDALWHIWLNRETQQLGTELAQAATRQEQQRLRAKRAFGRVEALGRLRAQEATERKLKSMRKVTDQISSL
jgi:hypothetical protein